MRLGGQRQDKGSVNWSGRRVRAVLAKVPICLPHLTLTGPIMSATGAPLVAGMLGLSAAVGLGSSCDLEAEWRFKLAAWTGTDLVQATSLRAA
jgi:hypothetical protein